MGGVEKAFLAAAFLEGPQLPSNFVGAFGSRGGWEESGAA